MPLGDRFTYTRASGSSGGGGGASSSSSMSAAPSANQHPATASTPPPPAAHVHHHVAHGRLLALLAQQLRHLVVGPHTCRGGGGQGGVLHAQRVCMPAPSALLLTARAFAANAGQQCLLHAETTLAAGEGAISAYEPNHNIPSSLPHLDRSPETRPARPACAARGTAALDVLPAAAQARHSAGAPLQAHLPPAGAPLCTALGTG